MNPCLLLLLCLFSSLLLSQSSLHDAWVPCECWRSDALFHEAAAFLANVDLDIGLAAVPLVCALESITEGPRGRGGSYGGSYPLIDYPLKCSVAAHQLLKGRLPCQLASPLDSKSSLLISPDQ